MKKIVLLFVCCLSFSVQAEEGVWDLTDLYPDINAWDARRAELSQEIEELHVCKGVLGKSSRRLAECLDRVSEAYKELLRLYAHAYLAKDIDLGDSVLRERVSMAQTLFTRFSEITSFIGPELVDIGERKLNRFMRKNDDLKPHDFFIQDTLRRAEHILSPKEEKILAAAQDAMSVTESIHEVLSNAEIPWPEVTLSTGETVRLDAQGYVKNRTSPVREDRKLVFDRFFGTLNDYKQTLALALEGTLKQHVFTARARGYKSSLHQALDEFNIPEEVYRALVTTVNDNLEALHRMLTLRQKLLGLEQSEYYDVYPSVMSLDQTYDLEDARRITLKAFAPLGEEYLQIYREAINQDWVHVYPRTGKSSGAYMMGVAYDVHPYMLLNFQNDLESVSTYAHEWGHAMHSLLANQAQPFSKADYATFTAEIASIVNEVLLWDLFRAQATSNEEKLYFLMLELQQIRGTFFRQTQFAEFELESHALIEDGGALSGDKLNSTYGEILKRYLGSDQGIMHLADTYTVEWSYVPHFYRNFYVYQYATSMAAAYYLADQIKQQGEPAQQRYLAILRAGGSDYPYNILLNAGVDMASPEVYQAVIDRVHQLLDEAETLLKKQAETQE